MPVLVLDILEVQISDLFGWQEEVVLVLAIEPDRELSLANAELVFRLDDAFKDLSQVFRLLQDLLEIRLFV